MYFEEIKYRKQNDERNINYLCIQIEPLYKLFLHNYSVGKRSSRLPYVFLAIGLLTLKVNYDIPIRKQY